MQSYLALNDFPSLPWNFIYTEVAADKVTWRMLLLLALPSLSDAVATLLAYIGLAYIPSSIYQMMKSTIIIFVAIFKVSRLPFALVSTLFS